MPNSNSLPDYNSNNENPSIIHSIKKLPRSIIKKIKNVDLEHFEKYIKKHYKKTTPSFVCKYYVIDRIRALLKKKFSNTLSNEEKKELKNLKSNLTKFIKLDSEIIDTTRETNILNTEIGDLEIEMETILRLIDLIKIEYDDAVESNNSSRIKKYKKKGLEHSRLLTERLKQLKKLKKDKSKLSKKFSDIFENFTKLLKIGAILITPEGNHFVNDTNYLDPTIELYLNNPNGKKIYTQRPPSYKKTQKNHKLSKKYLNKWKKSIKQNSYHTADENSNTNTDHYYSAEENKN